MVGRTGVEKSLPGDSLKELNRPSHPTADATTSCFQVDLRKRSDGNEDDSAAAVGEAI